MGNIVIARPEGNRGCKTAALYQYDYGQVLKFEGMELPESYEVHFGNDPAGTAVIVLGDAQGAPIPDSCLAAGRDIYAWLYLHTGTQDGETVYSVVIPVIPRAAASEGEADPVQRNALSEAVALLTHAADGAAEARRAAEAAADRAGQALIDSGDYDKLEHKPSINHVELAGNVSLADLGAQPGGDYPENALTNAEIEALIRQFV